MTTNNTPATSHTATFQLETGDRLFVTTESDGSVRFETRDRMDIPCYSSTLDAAQADVLIDVLIDQRGG
jgi:hypothetical protein